MRTALDLIGSILPGLAARGTLMLLVGFLLAFGARRASAAWRHLLWTASLASVLALPFAAVYVPPIRIPVLPATPISGAAVAPANASQPPPPKSTKVDARASRPTLSQRALSSVDDPADLGLQEEASLAQPAGAIRGIIVAANRPWSATTIVALLWLIGVAVLVARFVVGAVGIRRLLHSSVEEKDSRLTVRAEVLAQRLGLSRHVAIRVAGRECIPVTWGVLLPTVLLPSEATSWTDDRLNAVLLHELGHVARFDALTQMIAQLAAMLLWFNPLVWLSAYRARIERERACDDLVLANGTRASRYAEDLLALVVSLEPPGQSEFAALAMARRSDLEGRVLAIIEPKQNRRGITRAGATCAVAVWIALTPVASVAIVAGVEAPSEAPAHVGAGRIATVAGPLTPKPEDRGLAGLIRTDSVRDSAGVKIVDNPAPSPAHPAFRVVSRPTMSVLVGDPSDTVAGWGRTRLAAGVFLSDGRLVVSDIHTQELRFYSSTGALIDTVVNPGDNQNPMAPAAAQAMGIPVPNAMFYGLGRMAGDSILATQPQTFLPCMVLDPTGRRVRDIWIKPSGVFADGSFMVSRIAVNDPMWGPPVWPSPRVPAWPVPDGDKRPSWVVGRATAAEAARLDSQVVFHPAEFVDTIAVYPGKDPGGWTQRMQNNRTGGRMGTVHNLPFGRQSSVVADSDRVVISEGSGYELREYVPKRGLTRIIRANATRAEVTPAMIADYKERSLAGLTDYMLDDSRTSLDAVVFPKYVPAIGGIRVDPVHRIWVHSYAPDGEDPWWAIFAPDGTLLGTVALPADGRLLAIGARAVAIVEPAAGGAPGQSRLSIYAFTAVVP